MCLSVDVLLLFKKEKQAKSLVGNFVSLRSGLKKEFWEVPIIAGGWGHPPLQKAAVFGVGADVSSARGLLPAKQHGTGQASSRGGERVDALYLCSFQGWKEPKIPGGWLRGVQALQSPAPGPPLRGTLPGQLFRASGAGGSADCPRFRAAAAGWDFGRKPSGWTRKARLVHAAVGAGGSLAGR